MSGYTLIAILLLVAVGVPLYRLARYVWSGRPSRLSDHDPNLEELVAGLATADTRHARLLGAGDVLVGLGAGLAVVRWMPHEFDVGVGAPLGNVLVWLSYVLGYALAAGLTIAATNALGRLTGTLPAYTAALALFVFGFVVPIDRAQEAKATRAELLAEFAQQTAAARRRWRADVQDAGVHGPLGVEPPMLAIVDDGRRVSVTNVTDTELPCVVLGRVGPRVRGTGQRRCFMRDTRGDDRCYGIGPGGTADFRLNAPYGEEESCASARLEFRVGDYEHPEPTWWSDTALAQFDRNRPDAPVRGGVPAVIGVRETWRTQPLNDDALAAESARLAAIHGEAGRAQRWREALSVWAASKQAHATAVRNRESDERQARLDAIDSHRRTLSVIAEMHRTGTVAASGELPPMLEVTDEGRTVTVRNLMTRPLTVRVMRAGPYEIQGRRHFFDCRLSAARHGTHSLQPVELAPRESETFTVPYDHLCSEIDQTTLSFAIHDADRLLWTNEAHADALESEARQNLSVLERLEPSAVIETAVDDFEFQETAIEEAQSPTGLTGSSQAVALCARCESSQS